MLKKLSSYLFSLFLGLMTFLNTAAQTSEKISNPNATMALQETITPCLLKKAYPSLELCRDQVSNDVEYCFNQVNLRKDLCWTTTKTDEEALQCVETHKLTLALEECENKEHESLIICSENFSKEVTDCWKQNSPEADFAQGASDNLYLNSSIQCLKNDMEVFLDFCKGNSSNTGDGCFHQAIVDKDSCLTKEEEDSCVEKYNLAQKKCQKQEDASFLFCVENFLKTTREDCLGKATEPAETVPQSIKPSNG
ncbi:MAG: hypothetical protein OXB86_02305 [Bdellovibrionales bacterium]|nr:hypothetical protein [Bdellovibrionales bacterium]